jgi:hypothetical protein
MRQNYREAPLHESPTQAPRLPTYRAERAGWRKSCYADREQDDDKYLQEAEEEPDPANTRT